MNLGHLGHPLLQGAREGGDCIFLRPAEVNLLRVCKQCLPVSDGVRLPCVIVQSLVSYQVWSTWLFSYPLSLVPLGLFAGSWQTADARQRGRIAGDVLLASTPTASSGSSLLPCAPRVTQMRDASAASGGSGGTATAVLCVRLAALNCRNVCRGKPNSAFFREAVGSTRSRWAPICKIAQVRGMLWV